MAHLEHLRVAGHHDSAYNVKMHHVLMFGLSSKPNLESLWVNYTRNNAKISLILWRIRREVRPRLRSLNPRERRVPNHGNGERL
jgi:hypothetical protein